ncbi:response regulator transcription factor [Miniphocaeibacter halophilus]|uniref:Response regulator transcription factor n=1 Tax=Miniphocaeibacter halophilus TaxID=2931922 RepID=A0AC61MU18_9FIRM|nr:response regulator transcription factor [Miniphocaeibacter halophilus]QQK07819.1 response regulator transcription factor [Miniphocaeibacter halophilus]
MRVLIVEDEVRLSEAISEILKSEKYDVDVVHNGDEGLDYGLSDIYDCIILDVMLPGIDGFTILKELRKAKISTPILMLTAKDEISNKVEGLDYGADDYMTKPFDIEELLARIRSITRRQGQVYINNIEFEDLKLDLSNYNISTAEKSINLTAKEFEIMKLLMSNINIVVTKDELISKIWGYDSDAEDNNVEVYISFLRKKLKFIKSKVSIVTLRKLGYKLEYAG